MTARSFASIVAERLLVQRPGLGAHPAGRCLLPLNHHGDHYGAATC